MDKDKNLEDNLGLKLGSDEMKYWKTLIDNKKQDLKVTEDNLKFFKFIIENAEEEYKKAEEEFNDKKVD